MIASRKNLVSRIVLVLALMAAVAGVAPANAQEYKETFNSAIEAARASDLSGAVDLFADAAEQAAAANDAEVARKAKEFIAKIEYQVGTQLIKDEKVDEALTHFVNGIQHYPTFSKNHLARASALKKQEKMDEAIAAFVETISVAEAESDTKTARAAEDAIRGHFVFMASSRLSRNGATATRGDADAAIGYLDELQQYVEPDADVYYYLAEANKIKGEYQTAIELANQALEVHRGSLTDKAKIWYVIGEAHMSLGDNSAAKTAFANAAYGPYKNSAEHYIETLGTE